MILRFLTSVFNALRQGKNATQIIGSIAKATPKVADKLTKLAAAGYTADFILSRLVSPEGKIPESMVRSDFGDYLAQLEENNKKDYNRLLKTLVTAGVGAKAVSDIFKRNNIPTTFLQTPATPPPAPKATPTTINVGGMQPQAPAQIGTPTMQPAPPVAQALPPQQRIQTTVPASGGGTIQLPPPQGLSPQQTNILAREAGVQRTIPTGQPIALPQQMPMAQPTRMQPQAPAMAPQPIAMPTRLLGSTTVQKKPALGQAIVKAAKQGLSKDQILRFVKNNLKPVAAEFEKETGMSIEDAIDEVLTNKDTIEAPKLVNKMARLPLSKQDKALTNAGLKPKLKSKTKTPNVADLAVQAGAKPPTDNVAKQAFLMNLMELKKLFGE